jgi:HTH-type transcriptional regulator/antitoxin HigA
MLCALPLALCSRIALLDTLIDEVGEDESHPLASFIKVLGILIEKYEDEHVPELALE